MRDAPADSERDPERAPGGDHPATVDVIVIGAGPAGLQAAATISRATERFLLVDAGRAIAHRDRHAAGDIVAGVGGAGLFSDGKFSFFPAATELWRRRDPDVLRRAYHDVTDRLRRHGVPCPPFPERLDQPAPSGRSPGAEPDRWIFKDYPATYLDLAARIRLIEELFAFSAAARNAWLETRLVGLRRDGEHWRVSLQRPPERHRRVRSANPETSVRIDIAARHVILAGGRFSPLWLASLCESPSLPMGYRRVEFGVRIEDRSSSPLFRAMAGVDSKYRLRRSSPRPAPGSSSRASGPASGPVEWRTFCCCRDGEVVATASPIAATDAGAGPGWDRLVTASGRADGPPTGRSNIGLLARVLDSEHGRVIWSQILDRCSGRTALFDLALTDVLTRGEAPLAEHFGDAGARVLLEGLRRFCAGFPGLADSPTARLLGPVIEGVGCYPADHDLQIGDTGLWVAGDGTGRFRGIVASLISGAYVAEQIARRLRRDVEQRPEQRPE